MYNDHPKDPTIGAIVDRWSLLRGHLCCKISKCDFKTVVVVGRWSLFRPLAVVGLYRLRINFELIFRVVGF